MFSALAGGRGCSSVLGTECHPRHWFLPLSPERGKTAQTPRPPSLSRFWGDDSRQGMPGNVPWNEGPPTTHTDPLRNPVAPGHLCVVVGSFREGMASPAQRPLTEGHGRLICILAPGRGPEMSRRNPDARHRARHRPSISGTC